MSTSLIPDPPPLSRKVAACLSYGAVSVSITLFNKAVFTVYKFPYPCTVTALQISVSLVYMVILQRLKLFDYGKLSFSKAKQAAPLAILWWLYVVSGLFALSYLNVPMFSVLRRGTTLLVVGGEWLIFARGPSLSALLSILVMIAGAIIAGITDLTFSLPGYIWVAICAVSTAAYLLLIKYLKDESGLSQNALLFYNNLLALPIMLAYLLLATDELQHVRTSPQLYSPSFQAFLLLSASQAFLLNLCIFWCTTVNSPVATTVTGQMKDVLTTGLGLFLFGDVRFSAKNIIGVAAGLIGGMLYSAVSLLDRRPKPELAKRIVLPSDALPPRTWSQDLGLISLQTRTMRVPSPLRKPSSLAPK
ncbi:hypothetical protein WJX74_009891 [Apatococcus lobatus]|uniref:Sugar phosphate transporter domain-containing protein n=1 Tax=Apatococcus lobatus TaxID=904363 RepID=A0AAW1QWX5_9CHLO